MKKPIGADGLQQSGSGLEQSYHGPENFGRFVDRDMQPCTWEVELRQMLERRQHLSSFGYQRMLRMLVAFAPKLFEELDRLRAP